MKTTLKLIIALVLAGAGIGQAWGEDEPPRYIGHITYTEGEDDHGTLHFYMDEVHKHEVRTGVALDTNELKDVWDDEGKLLGYSVYIYAYPDEGYTAKGMTLEAELTTTVMQSRRNKAADSDASFDIGQKLTLTPVKGTPYMFKMVMPKDPNLSVTVTAKFAEKAKNKEPISYIDADGVTQTKKAETVYVLDGTEAELGVEEKDTWYVCSSTLSYEGREVMLKAVGDVHLILADGAEMSVEIDGGSAIDLNQKSLTIYGQSTGAGMGRLTVNSDINGIGAGGTVTINSGEVSVNGNKNGIAARNVNINGGKVFADGENSYGINSGGDITLGWNSADDHVYASSYHISETGSVKIADGKMLKYTDGNSQTVTLKGTLDADAIAGIAKMALTPYGYGGYCGKDNPETADADESKNVTWEIPLVDGAPGSTLTISGTGDMADYDNTNASVAGNFAPWIKPNANGNYSVGLKYESVTAVNIGEGVTSIGQNAFDSCSGLTSVTIGKDVTTIGENAFNSCGSLTSVTIGEGVNTIDKAAFMGCGQLTSVNIPASVATIGDGAFGGCGELTSVNIPASVTNIGLSAFGGCSRLTTVTVNSYVSGITTLGDDVFDACEQLTLILVPDEAAYNAYYGSSDDSGWNKYKAMLAPQTLTVAKNASGWGTYCHRFPVSYSLSDGAKAYKVNGMSEGGKSVEIEEDKVELEGNLLAAAAPATPLLLNYEGGEGDVTLTAVPATATTVESGDIVSTGEGCTISGNMTGSNLKHAAANDGIPALTGVADQTSYALYNGNFLRIDTDNGIDGHRCVLTVMGDASPEVIALSTAEVTQGTGSGIGRIEYSYVEGDHGELSFYENEGLSERLSPGEDLSTKVLEVVKDGENVVGYLVYVYAKPVFGYTVNGMTLKAELTTSVQQSRRFDSDDTNTLQIGRAIGLTPIEGKPYIFTMVMPNDPNINVSVTATFEAKATNEKAVSYIDADGATKEKEKGSVYVMDGTEEELAGWYVCESSYSYKRSLKAVGDVHLILADGAEMSVETDMDNAIDLNEKSLTIYGKSTGAGRLTVNGERKGIDAGGTFTINGGKVEVYGYYTGIAAGNVTINGGVFRSGGMDGIVSGGDITINGGGVNVNAYNTGIAAQNVNINGGKVTADGNNGYGIESYSDITLGWNSADDIVWAKSYHINGTGSVKIADGKVLKYTDGSETVKLRGTLDAATIAGKTLTPYGYSGYCGKASVNGGKNVVWEILAEDDAATTNIDESKTLNIKKNADVTGQTDFSMADYENNDASVDGNFAPWIKPNANGNASAGLKYESVTAVNIGEGVTSIGKNAFFRCIGLTTVTIGKDVTTIGESAFNTCDGLTSVTIGEGVTTIGYMAFMGCVGLTSVNIPASVTTIGDLAFGGCSGLTSVNIPASVTTIGDLAFSGCGYLTTVTVNRYGSDITALGGDVFDSCDKLTLILVPDEAAYDAYYKDKGWGDYKAKLAPQKMTVAKNASGWGTYCHRFPVSYSLSDGAKAYKVNGLSEDGKSVEIEEAIVEIEEDALNLATPAKPLLLNYKGTGSVTLTAVPATATPIKEGVTDIMKVGQSNWIFSGNTTGSNLQHTADTDDGIPALTGVADQTSYALYNGNFLRIDTDNGIDGHRCVLTVNGAASPDVIALTTAVVTPGDDGGIGRIVYSQSNGTLEFYKNEGLSEELDLEDLNTNVLEVVKDDNEKVVGYRIYVYAVPDEGYTVKDMTLKAELTTSVQQSRRFDSAEPTTLQIGGAIELKPVEGKPYIFKMVMPNDPNINATVTATFAAKAKNEEPIEYIDADGATQTKEARSVYVLDGTEEVLVGFGNWYVCNSDLTYNHKLNAIEDVHLILADGATMSVVDEDDNNQSAIEISESLTIYGQSTGADMGSLSAKGEHHGIGAGSVTINGGKVTATGNSGIGARNVNINGGEVTANGTGSTGYGINSFGNGITLGWNSAAGYIKATGYNNVYGADRVKIADGKVLKYTDGNKTVTLRGTLNAADIAKIADKTLTPYGYGGYCGKASVNGGKDVTWEIPLVDGAPGSTLTISGTGEMADYENTNASNFAPWIKPDKDGNASDGLKYESVTAVNIGEGVTYIGQKAFDSCGGLKSVTIGEGVTTIGESAFMGCWGITSVNIPASVATIGDGAFSSCSGLTTVTVNRYVSDDEDYPITTLGSNVFASCDNLTLILVPNEAAYDAYYDRIEEGWKKYKDKLAPQRMTVAKNASGWGSYCHRFHVSYSVDGATAYAMAGLSEGGKSVEIEKAKVIMYDDDIEEEVELTNHAAPATPLLLNYGSTGSVTLSAVPATATKVEDGIANISGTGFWFYGNPTAEGLGAADCDFINAEGYNSYMLYDGEFVRIDENKGLAAHRCVLNVANGGDGEWAARVLTIADGEATGMGSLTPDPAPNSEGSECIFTLDGRRVGGKPAPGIYVKGGRKVVIK